MFDILMPMGSAFRLRANEASFATFEKPEISCYAALKTCLAQVHSTFNTNHILCIQHSSSCMTSFGAVQDGDPIVLALVGTPPALPLLSPSKRHKRVLLKHGDGVGPRVGSY
jgi:hypothetical protein